MLESRCDEVEAALRQAQQRQLHEGEALAAELRKREEELGNLLLDSRAKTQLLSEALAAQTSAQARRPQLEPPPGSSRQPLTANLHLEVAPSPTPEQAKLQQLHVRAAEAERMHTSTQRQLRRVDAELSAVRAERARLEAELASISQLAKDEMAEIERGRAAEVEGLLERAKARAAGREPPPEPRGSLA